MDGFAFDQHDPGFAGLATHQHRSWTDPTRRQALPRWVLVDYYMLVHYMMMDRLEGSSGRRAILVVKRVCAPLMFTSVVKYLDTR